LQDFYKSCNFYVHCNIKKPLKFQEILENNRFLKTVVSKNKGFY